jgi:3-dehydroquinate synthase
LSDLRRTIDVDLPASPYAITIEPGRLEGMGILVRDLVPNDRAMLAIDTNVADPHGSIAGYSLIAAGFEIARHELIADEKRKTLATVEAMYAAMLAAKLDRRSPVIALGGGVVGDIAGFAAATYLRGVPIVQAPTTLLAMVDASVGGKTGVNFPLPPDADGCSELGKNLVGAFWQPRAVLIDPLTLRTLDDRDFRCGLAECVKHGVIADADLITFIEANAEDILALDMSALVELIDRSVRIKASIVEADEREAGRRALLNLGHTFAHAIEPIEALDLRHGEAVSIGLCAACRCAVQTGRMNGDEASRVERLLSNLELPTRLRQPVSIEPLVNAMGYDKKVASGRVRLVLPRGLGEAELVDDVDEETLRLGWAAVASDGDA